jgi:hypothetical protein
VARLGPSMAATCTRGKPEGGGGYMGTTGKRCGTYRSSQCSRSLLNSMRWDANIETFPDRGSLNLVHHDTRVFFGCFLQEEGGESMQEMGGGWDVYSTGRGIQRHISHPRVFREKGATQTQTRPVESCEGTGASQNVACWDK